LNNLGVEAFNYDNMYKFIVPMLLILFGLNILFKGSNSSGIREELRNEQRRKREAIKQKHREMKEQIRNSNRHTLHKHQPLENYQPTSFTPSIEIPDLPLITSNESEPEDPNREEKHKFTEQAYKEAYKETYKEANKDTYKDNYKETDKNWKWKNLGHQQNNQHDKVNRSSFIGDIHYGHEDWDLTPMNVSLFIGDTVIDLTKASIPDGETTIYVSSFIGDCKIFIPNDMQLEVSVTASAFISDMKVLDRYESGLFKNLQAQTRDYVDADKKIRIMVSTFIGDVIVKRVG
jgi:lia operon protein LiaF